MLMTLPAIAALGIFIGCRRLLGCCSPGAALVTSVLWYAFLVLGIEAMSFFRLLTGPCFSLWWATGCLGVFAYLRTQRATTTGASPQVPRIQCSGLFTRVDGSLICTLAALLSLIALATPSSNYDSQTYHIPRVYHWIQNQSVEHYPSAELRQISLAPGAEYFLLATVLLTGNDAWFNCAQLFSAILSLCALEILFRQFGPTSREWRGLLVVLALTLPQGALESITTQNDYLLAYWCLVVLVFCGDCTDQWRWKGTVRSLAIGTGLGLAMLTKSLALVYVLPWVVLYGIRQIKRTTVQACCLQLLYLTAAFLLIMAPNLLRNVRTYQSPLGDRDLSRSLQMQRFSPSIFMANVVMNLGMHAPPRKPGKFFEAYEQGLFILLEGLGVEPGKPLISFESQPFRLSRDPISEDAASCFFHLWLTLLAVLVAATTRTRGLSGKTHVACLGMSFATYCILLRWQIWATRFQIFYFLAAVPFIVTIIRSLPIGAKMRTPLGLILWSWCVSILLTNERRPVLSSDYWKSSWNDRYFVGFPHYREDLEAVAQLLSDQRSGSIGLVVGRNSPENFLWIKLREQGFQGRLEHAQPPITAANGPYEAWVFLNCPMPSHFDVTGWQVRTFSTCVVATRTPGPENKGTALPLTKLRPRFE